MTKEEKRLDRLFSQYIRLRDTKEKGFCTCCSCSRKVTYDTSDAGHYISRGYKSTKYDEINVHAQCRNCNRFRQGMQRDYQEFIIKRYGKEEEEKLYLKSKMLCKRNRNDFLQLIEHFKSKVNELKRKDKSI